MSSQYTEYEQKKHTEHTNNEAEKQRLLRHIKGEYHCLQEQMKKLIQNNQCTFAHLYRTFYYHAKNIERHSFTIENQCSK